MVAVLQPLKQGKVIAIDRAVIMVGRGSDCDAIITNSQKISRRHCCLVQVDNAYFIRDLGSMNGIWVNGKRVSRVSPMQLGDKVQIGDVEFQFHPNARIESKRTVVTETPAALPTGSENAIAPTPAANAEPVADIIADVVPGDGGAAELMKSDQIKLVDSEADVIDDVKPIPEEEFEIIDDVVPLEEDEAFLLETNEVEIIDEPILDESSAEDAIVAAELIEEDLVEAVEISDAEILSDEVLDAEILDAEIVESTADDDDDEDEIIIFED